MYTLKTESLHDTNFVVMGVVITIAASDDKVGIMITLDFQCRHVLIFVYVSNIMEKWNNNDNDNNNNDNNSITTTIIITTIVIATKEVP